MDMAGKVLASAGPCPTKSSIRAPAGDAVRSQVGQAAYDLNVQQYCCGGLNFGYFYDRSPIIAYDGAEPPAYTMADFTPSTVPGCRVPFATLPGGRPVYDALGPGYTLLRLDSAIEIAPLVGAMRDGGVPLEVVDVQAGDSQHLYDRKLDSGPNRPARGLARRCRSGARGRTGRYFARPTIDGGRHNKTCRRPA